MKRDHQTLVTVERVEVNIPNCLQSSLRESVVLVHKGALSMFEKSLNEMYSQLTFSYMITDDFGEIELPSPLEQPGQKTKNLLQELEAGESFMWKTEKIKRNLPLSGYVYGRVSPIHADELPA